MKEFKFEWLDICDDIGTITLEPSFVGDIVSITLRSMDKNVIHHLTPEHARALAGALLAAAQQIDPLPSTKPTPAKAPDQLT